MLHSFRSSHRRRIADGLKDNRGIAAVEFALVLPVMVGIGLIAIVLSFKLFERQRLESSVAAVTFFLDHTVMNGDISDLQPVKVPAESGGGYTIEPGPAIQTAKLVLKDAYKSNATLTLRSFKVFCGCPNSSAIDPDQADQPYFTRFDAEPADEAPICSRTCSDSSPARVLAEIDVEATTVDVFGQPFTLYKKSVTRLR